MSNGNHASSAHSRKAAAGPHQSTQYYAQGTRSMSSGSSAHGVNGNYSSISFDRKSVHGLAVTSKHSSSGMGNRDILRPVTYNGNGDLSYFNGSGQASHAAKDMANRPATGRRTPGAASIASLRNGSSSPQPQPQSSRNVRYYSNGGVGSGHPAAAAQGGCSGGPTASTKSSSSSLKASNNNGARRQSWRHSHKSSGTSSSFAQKLRSFAVFNWSASSSSGGGGGNNDHSPPVTHKGQQMVVGGGGGSSVLGNDDDNDYDMAYVDNRREQHDSKRNSCCPSQLPSSHTNGFGKRLTELHAQLETISSSPSYGFEVEMASYASSQQAQK
ncbi:hypothetical protein GGI21_003916 [Coemansia aciculifera]|nr:hypothetical protein GGI21_003916 [Coemansia aciculifera]